MIINKLIRSYYENLTFIPNYIPCVVFDIDGTILKDGIYSPSNNTEIIQPILQFLYFLQKRGITIFILTARPDNPYNRLKTDEMLHHLNINFKHLFMMNMDQYDSQIIYKQNVRKYLVYKHYNIIMSLGDNTWDYGEFGIGVHVHDDGRYITFHPS